MSYSTEKCEQSEALHDYVFDELSAAERGNLERHLTSCMACTRELEQLQFTTAALRSLPDREIPQRIGFVSDKIFEPSPLARFFRSAWAGFASAGVMAAALVFTVLHQPSTQTRTVVQTAAVPDVSAQINEAVSRAVRQVRAEDAQVLKAALSQAESKHEQEHRMLLTEMRQTVEVMDKRMGTMTTLASLEGPPTGGDQ